MTTSRTPAQANLRGIGLMVLAMAGFSAEDVLIKTAAQSLPAGQVVISIGLIGALMTALVARRQSLSLFPRASFNRITGIRVVAEIVASLSFTIAIVLTDLSAVSAILQATPLIVTLGAAWFLGETVGWRRYLAICIGLMGVLLIIRPGAASFEAASLLALTAAIALAVRDLAIRSAPPAVHSLVVAFQGMLVYAASGVVLLAFSSGLKPVTGNMGILLVCAGALGFVAYLSIIAAMRAGEVSIISPFRYSRLLFGMAAGMIVFAERPDLLTWAGAALVLGTGLYTAWREQVRARSA